MKMQNVEDVYALSPMQQMMLLFALSAQEGDVLVEQFRCSIRGPLCRESLRRAWQQVVDRHGVLRTVFAWEGLKQPLQIVRQKAPLVLVEHDLTGVDEAERPARLETLLAEDRRRGFDLTKAPLLRVVLVRTGTDAYEFVLCCHHLVGDGWCLVQLLQEGHSLYQAQRSGVAAEIPSPRPFRDYIAWLARQDKRESEAFYRSMLAGVRSATPIPLARASRGPAGYDETELALDESATARLKAFATSEKLTLAAVLQGAWALLLGHYASTGDVTYGLTVSGRPPSLEGVESMVGPLINNVPVRVAIDRNMPVAKWLHAIHALHVELRAHEHIPPADIQRAAGFPPGRRMFETLLVLENLPAAAVRRDTSDELSVGNFRGSATSNFPITLVVMPQNPSSPQHSMLLRLRYDTAHVDDQVGRLLPELAELLDRMIARGATRLGELPMPQIAAVHTRGAEHAGAAQHSPWSLDPIQWNRRTVDPRPVADILLQHPLVDDFVAAARIADGRPQIAAFVVASKRARTVIDASGRALLLSQLGSDVRQALSPGNGIAESPENGMAASPAKSPENGTAASDATGRSDGEDVELPPVSVVVVERIARDDARNVLLDQLPEPVRTRPGGAGPIVPPRTPLETQLCDLWSELLNVAPVGIADRFADLGGHSTQAVALVGRIEEIYGRRLPLVALFEQPTVERLAGLLEKSAGAAPQSLVVPIQPGGEKPPLFCIHPAGGTVFCYLELARHLGDDQPLLGIQAQGIDGELPPHATIEEMAACYADAIRAIQPAGPYDLGGWSTGGIIAFEVARQFEQRGESVGLLALFDAAQPDPEYDYDHHDFLPLMLMMFPGEDQATIEELKQRSPEEQLAFFNHRAQLAQVVVDGLGAGQAQSIFDVFRANVDALAAYRPQPYGGRVTLLRAAGNATPMHADPHLGWSRWARGGIDVIDVPGDHITMFQPPTVAEVARRLRPLLGVAPRDRNSIGETPALAEGLLSP